MSTGHQWQLISNFKLYALSSAAVLAVMVLLAWYTMQQRDVSFTARLDHLHQLKLNQLQQLNFDARQQAIMAAQLVATDQQLKHLLLSASALYQQNREDADLQSLRNETLNLLSRYWQVLVPFSANQLHLHLAPDAFTFLRAHRPERYGDKLADVRPIVMQSMQNAEVVAGIELGRHGLGLRAVAPITDKNGVVQAGVEVGLDIQKVLQSLLVGTTSTTVDQALNSNFALLVSSNIVSKLNDEVIENWYQAPRWSTRSVSVQVRYWITQNKLPLNHTTPLMVQLNHQQKQYLVSILPLNIWSENPDSLPLVMISWQDISEQIDSQKSADNTLWLTWLLATIVLLAGGVVLVSYLRKEAQLEVEGQQILLAQSEQQLSALYQLSPLPILLNRFDDGAFVEANAAMEQLVGFSLDEIKQLSYWDLTPERYAAAEQLQLKSLSEKGRYGPYVKQYKHKNGELIDIELNGVLFTDHSGEKFIWTIIKDIREIKRVEKLKDDFVSTVSHELRTPLTSISGSLGLVLGGAGGELSVKAEKLLSIAHKNSQRLNFLINDLLDIDKLIAGKMRFDESAVTLKRLLVDALEQHQPFASQHKVSLKLHQLPDVQLWVDAARVQQVLANLLSNAVKFSPEGGTVEVGSELIEQKVRIWVKDQGPGIALQDQQQLFKRFSQLNHANQSVKGGTGLGLAISREIVLQSGGDIGVESMLAQGATFWLTLPVYQASTLVEKDDAVLVIEDDKDTALVLCEFLRMQNYKADWAPDTKTAWYKLAKKHYVAITLDLILKEESGADFFLRLRDSAQTASIPVLIVSAFVEKGRLQLSAIANALDWLEKPVNPGMLGLKLGQLLSQLPLKNKHHSILHIEDDSDIVTIMRLQLESLCEYQAVSTLAQANLLLDNNHFDLILLDLGLPDGNGLSLLAHITQTQGDIPVVIFSAQDLGVNDKAKVQAVFSKSRINTEVLAQYLKKVLH